MTQQDAHDRVAAIRAKVRDAERAHEMEDQLYRDALKAVAEESEDPASRALAHVVLQADEIDFPRWCA